MSEMITEDDSRYAIEIVKAICDEVGPGLPGTHQERQRAAMIHNELASHLGAENVSVEEFTLAPEALLGNQRISAVFILLAALLNQVMERFDGALQWTAAIASLVFALIPLLVYVFEFHLGYEWVDPLFRKKTSENVIGALRKPGAREVKRLLILSGHHDSALEFTWLRFLKKAYILPYTVMFLGMVAMIVMSAIQLAGVITKNADVFRGGTIGWVMLAVLIAPSMISMFFFTRGRKNGGNVPGAADNLSASALAVSLCRFLVKNPEFIPEDTEIRFISFGSEEAGVRGSRRYVERHLDELKRLDTRMLNYEVIARPEMFIITADMNGLWRYQSEAVQSAVSAAERAGVPYQIKPGQIGAGSDAGPFTKAGIKAVTILPFKAPEQYVAFYHQKWDRPEILTVESISNALKLALEWIRAGGE